MKQTIYLLLIFLTMSSIHPLVAQSYDTLWKRVAALEKRDLPQSVIDEATKIYSKAQQEKQLPQMLKAYLTLMQYRSRISSDSLQVDREALVQWAAQSQNVEEQAILYSILGEIAPRSATQQAYEYMVRSLQQREALLQVSAEAYLPLVEKGEASSRYGAHSLYDLLARRALDWLQRNQWNLGQWGEQSYTLPSEIGSFQAFMDAELLPASPYDGRVWALQIYQSLLHAYGTDQWRSAWLLTAIDAWEYLKSNLNFEPDQATYAHELTTWSEQYKAYPAAAHLCAALATHYLNQQKMVDALQWVRTGMQRYPKSELLNRFKNLEQQIIEPSFSMQAAPIYPGLPAQVTLFYKNLTQVSLEFYRLNLPVTSPLLNDASRFSAAELKRYGQLEHKQHFNLPATPTYLPAEQQVTIAPLQPGVYYMRVTDGKTSHDPAATFVYVTSLQLIHRALPSGERQMVVIDAQSGHPVTDAEVVTYTRENELLLPSERYAVNKEGVAHIGFIDSYSLTYQVVTPRDSYLPVATLWGVKGNKLEQKKEEWNERIELFTDRGIYRPGQTIHLGGVLYQQLGDVTQTLPDKALEIHLLDSRYQEVAMLKSSSNRYGSFGASFTLPTTLLPGRFSIRVKSALATVVVEEYKRPTFDVKLTPPTTGYQAGDSISLLGVAKSFSNVPLMHATVSYQIERSGSWRWSGSRASWSGKTVTDGEGNFTLPVALLLDPSDKNNPWFYNFRITATVTSGAGESQAGSYTLPLGKTAWVMELEGWNDNQLWREQEAPLTIKLTNLVGQPIAKKVTYQVFEQTATGERGKQSLQGEATANSPFTLAAIQQLPSGKYLFVASVTDELGALICSERSFILLSKQENRLPFTADSWFCQVGNSFDAAQPATLYVGSSQQDVYLMYDLFAGDKQIDSQRILLSDSIVKFTYPYQALYGEGIRATFAFVKQGQLYSYVADVVKPKPDKRLILTWETFRDKLTPGSQEVWKLKVTHPDGTAADAELMATLYDASLEALAMHNWRSQLQFNRSLPRVSWSNEGRTAAHLTIQYLLKRWEEAGASYDNLWVPYELIEQNRIMIRGISQRMADAAIENSEPLDYLTSAMAKSSTTGVVADALQEERVAPERVQPLVDAKLLRQNFAETAFFYPALQTDANGVVTLSFTMPESLTTWKFKGYAHTQTMEHGMLEEEVVAAKKVMLETNLPRFVRAGDQVEFIATVMNRSDKAVSGTVRMELFQPETNQVVATKKVTFKAAALESVQLPFRVKMAHEERVLACRLVAEGSGFSDGEQRYLPVLSDKQWVTETVPFYIDQAGSKEIALDHLFNKGSGNLTNQRLTVEFTANPMWYVVQALPTLAHPTTDDAMAWAAALYATALSNKIVSDHPQLKQVIASWQAAGTLNETSFWSELQKNEALQGSLWEETPWLKEATDEAEQRRRLATLLDVNRVAQQQSAAIQQLQELQTADGSWSWYKGMMGNGYVTNYVVKLLVRMQLAAPSAYPTLQEMVTKAMSYLQAEVAKEYAILKEADRKKPAQQALVEPQLLSSQVVNYLYICSLDKQLIEDATMHNYLVAKLVAQPTHYSMENKATAVVILQAAGETKKAAQLLASILEYSVSTPEMGRYFDTNRTDYSPFDHKIPTQVAVLEAVNVMKADKQVVSEFKRWLLQQKQSQLWGTTVATTEAIYALLQTEGESYASPNQVTLQLGGKQLEVAAQNAWGYVKESVPVVSSKSTSKSTAQGMLQSTTKSASQSTPYTIPQSLTVTSQQAQLGWGAVYAQYLAPIAEVVGQSNGLHLTRTLLRNGEVVAPNQPLNPGDEVTVRLTLRADRTIDFVEVKEWRAACLEPQTSRSGYRYGNRMGYYEAVRDASVSFYLDRVPKGEYQLEYKVYVAQRGTYQGGIATVQSAYAPQFAGHTSGYVVTVK